MSQSQSERNPKAVDVCVIGGGINGAGVARDAVGRGYSVLLVEMGDIASATSSWSTKLIHGGLRYLEHNEFNLVRASLIERARLLRWLRTWLSRCGSCCRTGRACARPG